MMTERRRRAAIAVTSMPCVLLVFFLRLFLFPAPAAAGGPGDGGKASVPPAEGRTAPARPQLSSSEIYELCKIAKLWRGSKSRKALETLGACASQESFQALVRMAVDEYGITALRWACIKTLAVSKSDQAGLYIIDCHKELRKQFSQARSTMKLVKAYGRFRKGMEALLSNPAAPLPLDEFRVVLKNLLTGKDGGDLSLVALYALKAHPYQQVIDYLSGIARSGNLVERTAACNSIARMPGGLGLPALPAVLALDDLPEVARLASYDVLLQGYSSTPGASGVLIRAMPVEREPALALLLVKGAGMVAGREVLPEISKTLSRHPVVKPVYDWAVKAIEERNPSEWRWFVGFLSIVLVIGLTLLAVNFLRMPPTVIEKLYLEDTALCDVDVRLSPCEMSQVLQAVVRVDPSAFARYIRVSLIYEGEGEVAFRERSFCIADEPPYNFVGGGTIIDDWYWNQGRRGRVLANWFFDLGQYEKVEGVPIMIGLLYRGDEERPVIKLKFAGLKPDAAGGRPAWQDTTLVGKLNSGLV